MKLFIFALVCFFGVVSAQVIWQPDQNGRFPANSAPGGTIRRQVVFVCRAQFGLETVAGYLDTAERACIFGFGLVQQRLPQYDVATGTHSWQPYSRGQVIPGNAVFVGFSSERDRLFVCRVRHDVQVQVSGRLLRGICVYGYEGFEYTSINSDVMTDPSWQ